MMNGLTGDGFSGSAVASLLRRSGGWVASGALWCLVTVLLVLRPVAALVLLPLGWTFVLLSVIAGFALGAAPIAEHRWPLLAIGLSAFALLALADALIVRLDSWRHGRAR